MFDEFKEELDKIRNKEFSKENPTKEDLDSKDRAINSLLAKAILAGVVIESFIMYCKGIEADELVIEKALVFLEKYYKALAEFE